MFSAHKRFSETREDLGVHEEAAPSIPSEVSTRNGNKAGRDKEKLLKFEQTNRFSGERDAARIKTKGRTSPSGFLSDLDAALSPLFPPPPSVPPKRRILTTFRANSTIDHGPFRTPSTANDIGPDTIISRATNDQLDGRQSPDIFCPLAFFFSPDSWFASRFKFRNEGQRCSRRGQKLAGRDVRVEGSRQRAELSSVVSSRNSSTIRLAPLLADRCASLCLFPSSTRAHDREARERKSLADRAPPSESISLFSQDTPNCSLDHRASCSSIAPPPSR